jgi:site-specific recombinase XerC
LPRLGARQAITITRADIERLMSALRNEARLSATTVNKILATVKRVLEFGVQHGHLPSNPALGIRPIPRPSTRKAAGQS